METKNKFSNIICVKSADGIPLFNRSSSNSKTLPFQIIGTLNSIFSIGDKYGFRIDSIDSTELRIIWKMYHSNITLILIEELEPADQAVQFRKLDLIFDSMVIMYGLEDLLNISNVEKFKKEIKIAFPIIDSILFNYFNLDLFGGYLTNCVDLILVNDLASFQTLIDTSCRSLNTSYSCLLLNGRIVTASNAWWELNPYESYLISILCLILNSATSRDIPIYLPHKNPNQPLRLLTCNLSQNITLCFICSEKPPIDAVESTVKKLWHPMYKSVINLKQYIPRNLPNNIPADQNMIAFLLINKKSKCCTSSLCPNVKSNQTITNDESKNRYDILKYCYLNISSNFFHKNLKIGKNYDFYAENENQMTNIPEAYTLILDYRCYALNEAFFEFYALFNKSIPIYALRGVTKTCFEILTRTN